MRAEAKHLKQLVEAAFANERLLELQQRVLPVVHVHRMNLRRIIEQIIERVAAGAGDHHHAAVAVQFHQLPVEPRILPRCVVDEVGVVNMAEDHVMGRFQEAHRPGARGFVQRGHAPHVFHALRMWRAKECACFVTETNASQFRHGHGSVKQEADLAVGELGGVLHGQQRLSLISGLPRRLRRRQQGHFWHENRLLNDNGS
jgi:hypothetical protein